MNNFQLCSEINERVVQHFVHCTETHGRHVQYLKFLQTIVKAENKFIKKCQDIVMAEVRSIEGSSILFYKLHVVRDPIENKYVGRSFDVCTAVYLISLVNLFTELIQMNKQQGIQHVLCIYNFFF